MRFLVQIRSRTLDVLFTREPAEPETAAREVDLCSSTERAGTWDHDQREPIGFRRRNG